MSAVLPAAALLDMALTAAECVYPQAVTGLVEVIFHEAILVAEGAARSLQLVLGKPQEGRAAFAISSRPDRPGLSLLPWTLNATGSVSLGSSAPDNPAPIVPSRGDWGTPCAGPSFYEQLAALGIHYHGAWRALSCFHAGDGVAVGQLAAACSAPGSSRSHRLILLDAALQTKSAEPHRAG